MSNTVTIPFLSPFKFVKKSAAVAAGYHIAHFDEALSKNQLYDFQYRKTYCIKLQNSDPVYFQVVSNYGPVTCKLINQEEDIVASATVTAITTSFYTAPQQAYGISIPDLSAIPEGCYQLEMSVGAGDAKETFVSEPIDIAADFGNTILIAYSHRENKAGIIFENNEELKLRVEAVLTEFQPGSNDVIFEDQTADLIAINSTPFRSFKLILGGTPGIADWLIDKVNRILGCDTVFIDGKQFTKPDGAKLERNGEKEYPLAGWTVELREAVNEDGISFSNEEVNPEQVIYYGEQDDDEDPEDFDNSQSGNPNADITINYGTQPSSKYYWMAHVNGVSTKTIWTDINDLLNTGSIGGSTDLFETRIINIDGVDYTLYITRYATGFAGAESKIKYTRTEVALLPPADLTVEVVSTVASPDFPALVKFVEPDTPGDTYTLRLVNLDTAATTFIYSITASPHVVGEWPYATKFLVAIRTEKDGISSDWSADYLFELD